MDKFTNQKGITLIALIITIIIMLILVGVTINVALNGGLFEKAKVASTQTQKQAEKEELMSAAFGTIDTKGDLQIKKALESVLSQGWEIDDENTITDNNNQIWYTCKSPKGNTYYLNTTTGEIRETEPTQNPNPSAFSWSNFGLSGVDTNARYVLNAGSTEYEIIFFDTGIFYVGTVSGQDRTSLDVIDLAEEDPSDYLEDGIFTFNSTSNAAEGGDFGKTTISVVSGNLSTTVEKVAGNTESAGTYSYIKQNNVWKTSRGLTSSNVQFDYAYYNQDANFVLGFSRNGDYHFVINGNWSGILSDTIETFMNANPSTIYMEDGTDNTIICIDEEVYYKLVFNSENTVTWQNSSDGVTYSTPISLVKQNQPYAQFLKNLNNGI